MKVAYLIGNSDYEFWSGLRNPINDLNSMEEVLKGLGYRINKYANLNRKDLRNVSKSYQYDLYNASESLFYYSGHGIEVNGKLYLIPIDGKLTNVDKTVTYEAIQTYIDITNTVNEFPNVEDYVNIFVFDCCRDFCSIIDTENNRGVNDTEKLFNAKQGTFISFSTSPNASASDGKGNNGLFTKHLLINMVKPDVKIEDVFKEVRASVMKESNNKQIPWEHSSLIGEFSFVNTKTVSINSEVNFEDLAKELYSSNLSYVKLKEEIDKIYTENLDGKHLLIDNKLVKSEKDFREYFLSVVDNISFKEAK